MKFPIIFIFKAVSAFNGWLFSHIHMDSHLKFKVWNLLFVELYSVILLIRQNELWPANSKSDDNCVVKKWINFLSCLSLAEHGASTNERQPVKRHDWQPRPSSSKVLPPIRFFTNLLSVSTVLVQVFLFYYASENSSSLNLAPVSPLHKSRSLFRMCLFHYHLFRFLICWSICNL